MSQYDGIRDEDLILRLRAGEEGISDYLMEKYKEMVRKKARALFLVGGDTDDLIQEGMIGLFKAVRDYKPDRNASFQTFASLCVDRQIYKAIQNSNRKKNQPLNFYVSLSTEDDEQTRGLWTEDPESIVIGQEKADLLEENLSSYLSRMEQEVLALYLAGYGYVQISEKMNKSPKSIDNALQRIRTKVRGFLEKGR